MFLGLRTFRPSRGFIFQKNSSLRVIFQGRLTMTTGEDAAERLEKRAVEAEETIAVLNSQLLFLKKAAEKKMKSSGIKIAALKKDNDNLKQEVKKLKGELEYWEVRNGLKQVSLPTLKQEVAAVVVQEKADTAFAEVKEEKPAEKKPKKEKAAKKGKTEKSTGGTQTEGKPTAAEPDVHHIDFRVGKIVSAKKHPDADTLFVEEIDVGEDLPRTVCSGLVGSVLLEDLQDRMVIVMCNLKPVKMRGVTSQAMVMCSGSEDRKFFELLDPPEGSVPGDRVTFEGYPGDPDGQLNPKKKIWEQVKPHLRTNDAGVACYKDVPFTITGKGMCTSRTLKNAVVS
ncbi:aminoacyl tRNA synthase complex-interacting multifunctional protein 1-like isoform X2 [Acropora millepora]|uniref:aminoacyl tRNA synthase complex-interacting multifunctional protein 1-like isoform X2 n=1 Tax=Acropora millepora TaxID=45264 RepID=UPI001CF47D9D|nr:aminoacyl tRNA synthase complex-interacting multifunctional protein 1-like isoform X2 [Acropora millepora]